MARYRIILSGEGIRTSGEWFGFFATRDQDADSEEDAKSFAAAAMADGWPKALGTLNTVRAKCCWRPMPWLPRVTDGHSFFNDDHEARREAWSIEVEAANAPSEVRASKA